MNILAPISSIMTKNLITVNEDDSLEKVKAIFDENNIHHIPVVSFKEIVGIISKSDFLHFLHGFSQSEADEYLERVRLDSWKASEIMTKGLAKVDCKEMIRNVLEVIKINSFHALPIVDNDELVGIVTTFDIIKMVLDTPVTLEDYSSANA